MMIMGKGKGITCLRSTRNVETYVRRMASNSSTTALTYKTKVSRIALDLKTSIRGGRLAEKMPAMLAPTARFQRRSGLPVKSTPIRA